MASEILLSVQHGKNKHQITLPSDSTIDVLKRLVQEATGVGCDCQRLIVKGRSLPDDGLLCVCGIQNGTKLMLLAKAMKKAAPTPDGAPAQDKGVPELPPALRAVMDEVGPLSKEVQGLVEATKSGCALPDDSKKRLLGLDEMLMRSLLKIDGLEVHADHKHLRRTVVNQVNSVLELVDRLKFSPGRDANGTNCSPNTVHAPPPAASGSVPSGATDAVRTPADAEYFGGGSGEVGFHRGILVASGNPGKIQEIRRALGGYNTAVVTAAELGINVDALENGATLEENAVEKAMLVANHPSARGYVVLADDTGLWIDALNGEPGLHVRRWRDGITRMSDDEILSHVLTRMSDVEAGRRQASFKTTMVAVSARGATGEVLAACTGVLKGRILETPLDFRIPGFPMEPLFHVDLWGVTLGESAMLPDGDARKKSHVTSRAHALMEIMATLDGSRRVHFMPLQQ